MRALQCLDLTEDYSGIALADVPAPNPGPGELLVRIEASAVAFPDLLSTQGRYQARPDLPFIPGTDVAGTVMMAGPGVTRFREGDAVMAMRFTGGHAQMGVYREDIVHHKPVGLDFAEAAAMGSAYLTAWVALVERGGMKPGEWLVVHGAAGGVGLAAVDLGMALGARVIATASSPKKRTRLVELHAPEAVIDPAEELRDQILSLTCGAGADVIFDPVGGDIFDESTRCIAFNGRLLVIGFAGGRIASIATNVPLIKGFSVVGIRAGEYCRRFPERAASIWREIAALAEAGRITPHVHARFGLESWRDAYATMDDRTVVGRTVLLPWS